jgi:hypothetical protein
VTERATFATDWSSMRTHSRRTISSPRTKRAVAEAMDVSLLSKGGRYEVQSASDNRYEVDIIDESCTCPDWQQRSPEDGCKHLRCVDHEIKRGRVPRPDGRLPTVPG